MKERMNIVIVGHVDHGKSTLVGRLLAETKSLPEGKLEQVRRTCEQNSKPFEYAFLLDALTDEQDQGITIDTARVFFKSKKREYIIIDAPGHIEFLKNMISGAARAEAAVLLIDAFEGIAENSKRHAYMLSMLGIKQIAIAVNKMDLVNNDETVFNQIKTDYTKFLNSIGIEPITFVPLSARDGDNLVEASPNFSWYNGKSILDVIDSFNKEKEDDIKSFRMYVQDIYKFSNQGNDHRIIAGQVNSGSINIGEEIIFLPSGKKAKVKSIEQFNVKGKTSAKIGEAIGLVLDQELYIKPGELICKTTERPSSTTDRFRANIFWMGKSKLTLDRKYKLKIGTNRIPVVVEKIENVLNASELSNSKKDFVDRHEVAKCIFRTDRDASFDLVGEIEDTSRFVLVDDYDIAAGGIIVDELDHSEKNNQSLQTSDFEKGYNALFRGYFETWDATPLN